MRKFILIAALLLVVPALARAQTVQVPQDYLDSSTKAFREVIALREAVDAQKQALAAKDQTIAAQDALVRSQAAEIKLREEELDYYRQLKCNVLSFGFGLIKSKRCK